MTDVYLLPVTNPSLSKVGLRLKLGQSVVQLVVQSGHVTRRMGGAEPSPAPVQRSSRERPFFSLMTSQRAVALAGGGLLSQQAGRH